MTTTINRLNSNQIKEATMKTVIRTDDRPRRKIVWDL